MSKSFKRLGLGLGQRPWPLQQITIKITKLTLSPLLAFNKVSSICLTLLLVLLPLDE